MATINPTVLASNGGRHPSFIVLRWTPVTDQDTATSILLSDYSKLVSNHAQKTDILVCVTGTYSNATVAVEQSVDGTNWFPAKNPLGNAITSTSATTGTNGDSVRDDFRYLRFTHSGGAGTQSLTFYLQMNFSEE